MWLPLVFSAGVSGSLLLMRAFCFLARAVMVSVQFWKYKEKWLDVRLASLFLVS